VESGAKLGINARCCVQLITKLDPLSALRFGLPRFALEVPLSFLPSPANSGSFFCCSISTPAAEALASRFEAAAIAELYEVHDVAASDCTAKTIEAAGVKIHTEGEPAFALVEGAPPSDPAT
jgi:hypothetical protein